MKIVANLSGSFRTAGKVAAELEAADQEDPDRWHAVMADLKAI